MMVRMGEIAVADDGGTLRVLGVGSCVVIVLHDAENDVGAVAHPLLPEPTDGATDPENVGRYVTTVVEAMVERMRNAGADPARITARIAGGASMFPGLDAGVAEGIGERNIEAARQTLRASGIPIDAEEVGGSRGRTIEFCAADGRVRIRSVYGDDVEL